MIYLRYSPRSHVPALLLLIILPAFSVVLRGDDQLPPGGSGSQDMLPEWIAALGSDQFAERRTATAALRASGERAIPSLAEAVRAEDREVQGRAFSILLHFASSPQSSSATAARQALQRLAEDSDPQVARRSANALQALIHLAVQQLKQAGAKVAFDEQQPVSINLMNAKITDDDLLPLFLLPEIRKLELQYTPITDAGLQHLEQLEQLETCNLRGTKVTDDGLGRIASLTNIRVFSVENTQVTDLGLRHLRKLSQLETLYLGGSAIQGAGLAELAELPISYLSLQGSPITDRSVPSIVKLQHLRTLGLDETPVTDDCLPELRSLKKLEVLWLDDSGVTDQGIDDLGRLANLKTLHLRKTQITEDGLERLKELLPGVVINYQAR